MVTLQHRDTLPAGVLFANIGLCSCWVSSKQGTLVSHGRLADPAPQVLMRRGQQPHTWAGGEASRTSACSLHTHLNGHLRREGGGAAGGRWGRKDRRLLCVEDRKHRCLQQQTADCSRAVHSTLGQQGERRGRGRLDRLFWSRGLEQQRLALCTRCVPLLLLSQVLIQQQEYIGLLESQV